MSDPNYRLVVSDDEDGSDYSYRITTSDEDLAVDVALNSPETADENKTVTLVEVDDAEYSRK